MSDDVKWRKFSSVFSGNAFQNQLAKTSIHNLTQSHAADIGIIQHDIDAEREKREMGFSNVTRKLEMLTTHANRLTGEIEQITERLDHTVRNVSGGKHYPFIDLQATASLREKESFN